MAEDPGKGWRPTRKLDRGNAADQILQELRNGILCGDFPRGAKLPTEKQLSEAYGVSGPTVREAVRALTSMGMVDVRHGSGAYVTAQPDQLLFAPLTSVIQLEEIGIGQALGVMGALLAYAAELAATHATQRDKTAMREALDKLDAAKEDEAVGRALFAFLDALAGASKNPLLAILARYLTSLQIGVAQAHSDETRPFRVTVRKLSKERRSVLDAIDTGDPEAARRAARGYHDRAIKVVASLPRADWVVPTTFIESFSAVVDYKRPG